MRYKLILFLLLLLLFISIIKHYTGGDSITGFRTIHDHFSRFFVLSEVRYQRHIDPGLPVVAMAQPNSLQR